MSTQTGPLGLKSKFTLAAFAGLALCPFAIVRSQETGVEVLSLQGTANFSGSELPLEILMDRQGRFRETIGGWANQVTGFDGQTLWRIDDGAGPCQIDFLERELMLAAHWMLLSQRRDVESIQLQENTMQVAGGLLTFSISDRDGPGVQLVATNSPGQETIQIHPPMFWVNPCPVCWDGISCCGRLLKST